MKPLDVAGQVFGRLTVLYREGSNNQGGALWKCRCVCGGFVVVRVADLRNGHTKSCGCLRDESTVARSTKHGFAKRGQEHPVFRIWAGMLTRCSNPNHKDWVLYGGRGVRVCEAWQNSFKAFYEYIGPRPSPQHSVDRIDPDGNYEPGNVRWATAVEQANNTRRSRVA